MNNSARLLIGRGLLVASASLAFNASAAITGVVQIFSEGSLSSEIRRQLEELRQLAALGCDYVQLDEVGCAMLCDPRRREEARRLGLDPDALIDTYVSAINAIADARPKGMTIAVHVCRGNYKGHWMAEGGYAPIAIGAALANPKLKGWGVDIDEKLVRESNEAAKKNGVADRVAFFHRNIFDADLREEHGDEHVAHGAEVACHAVVMLAAADAEAGHEGAECDRDAEEPGGQIHQAKRVVQPRHGACARSGGENGVDEDVQVGPRHAHAFGHRPCS